jgi:hypothetical protein
MSVEHPVEVSKWSVHELTLTASNTHRNPYTEAGVTATFDGPGGSRTTVWGFWDGDRTFRVRFTPTREGEWTYATSSADAGLDGRHGTFRCVAPRAGARGFVRRDEAYRYHFVWDDGARYFMCGQTYYRIVQNAAAGGGWKAAIAGSLRRGMNKVRLLVAPPGAQPYTPYPATAPFGPDHDTLNPAHWRALDEVVAHLHDSGAVADLILFVQAGRGSTATPFGTPEQDERYLRYVIARYAAYPNVIWCLTNEWNYTGKGRAYWDDLGRIAAAEDPWARAGAARRALTIHQQTRIDWQFSDADWPVHACLQYGVRNGQRTQSDEWADDPRNSARYPHGDDWGNVSIVHNLAHGLPVVNDEYGYIGEPEDRSAPGAPPLTRDKHRRILWAIYAAGGYASAGDKTTYGDSRPYRSADWHDTAEYGDIQRLVDFFTTKGLAYWRMVSRNDVVTAGERAYVLAEPGRQYVVYAAVGGMVAIDLAAGNYTAQRFDPRTGEETPLGEVAGGGARAFALPDGDDWVLSLTSTASPSRAAAND